MVYFVMLFWAIIFLPKTPLIRKKRKNWFSLTDRNKRRAFLAYLAVFLVSALRYGVGTDYFYTYVPAFITLRNGYTYTYFEPAFEFLYKICVLISDNYQIVFIVTSFVIYTLLFVIICRWSNNPKLSFFIYFGSSMYFNSLSNVRQMIAMMICLFALEYFLDTGEKRDIIVEKENQKRLFLYIVFYALLLLAYYTHSSAIIFLIVPFFQILKKVKINYHIYIAILLAVIAIGLNYIGAVSQILNLVLNLLDRYRRYSSTNSVYMSFLILNIVIYLMMYLCAVCGKTNGRVEGRLSVFYINIQFTAVGILIFSNIIPWADRMARYFMLVQCVSVPHFLECLRGTKNSYRIMLMGFVFLYGMWTGFYIIRYGADGCFPYQNVLFIKEMLQKSTFGL